MRRERAENRWRQRIGEHDRSGQKVAEFCRERGICACNFYGWRKRLGLNGTAGGKKRRTFSKGPGGFQRIEPGAVIKTGDSDVPVAGTLKSVNEIRCLILTPNGYRVDAGSCDLNGLRGVLEVLRTL